MRNVIDDSDEEVIHYVTTEPINGGRNITEWIEELEQFGAEPQGSDGRETTVIWRSRAAMHHYEEVCALRHILSSEYVRLEAMGQAGGLIVLPESIVKALREVVKAYAQHQEVQVVPVRREESEE
jgi:hypothetical protein